MVALLYYGGVAKERRENSSRISGVNVLLRSVVARPETSAILVGGRQRVGRLSILSWVEASNGQYPWCDCRVHGRTPANDDRKDRRNGEVDLDAIGGGRT